jgi:CTP synthase
VHDPEHEVEVALVGKYIDLPDAYLSVTEALRAGGFAQRRQGQRSAGSPPTTAPPRPARRSGGVDGVLVPGGFGMRGIEGKLGALGGPASADPDPGHLPGPAVHGHRVRPQRRRHRGCELHRVRPDTTRPVIATMEEQKAFVEGAGDLGGTMRLGSYPAKLPPARSSPRPTARRRVTERHRHRYEVNNAYREQLEDAGLVVRDVPERGLVEFVELPRDVHPYYVATQAHPEFKSRPPT